MILRRDVLSRQNHTNRLRQVCALLLQVGRGDRAARFHSHPLSLKELAYRIPNVWIGDHVDRDTHFFNSFLNLRVRVFQKQSVRDRGAAAMAELSIFRIVVGSQPKS